MSFSAAIDRENEGTCAGQREGKWVRIRPLLADHCTQMAAPKLPLTHAELPVAPCAGLLSRAPVTHPPIPGSSGDSGYFCAAVAMIARNSFAVATSGRSPSASFQSVRNS